MTVSIRPSGSDSLPPILDWLRREDKKDSEGMLAHHYIEEARGKGVCVLEIECSPRTSIPFWKKMGFTMFPFNEVTQDRAYLVLDRSFPLPDDRPPVNVSIAFYPESKKWDQKIEPVIACSPDAVKVSADEIMLSARVICFDPHGGLGLDPVVGIEVNGDKIYLDKIKYEEVGVQRDIRNTFYLDRIILV